MGRLSSRTSEVTQPDGGSAPTAALTASYSSMPPAQAGWLGDSLQANQLHGSEPVSCMSQSVSQCCLPQPPHTTPMPLA